MSIAISALIAAAVVIVTLANLYTAAPVDSVFNAMMNFRPLPADTAMTALLYSTVIYAVTFSGSLFVLRLLGLFLAAVGFPNEDQIRRNRELSRQSTLQAELARRQAKLLAHYILRAQAMMPTQNPQPRSTPTRPRRAPDDRQT
jgi:hypothetical protein